MSLHPFRARPVYQNEGHERDAPKGDPMTEQLMESKEAAVQGASEAPIRAAATGCCGPAEQASCCAPSAKQACCGEGGGQECGCN